MERCVWRLIKKMKKPFIQANNIWKIYYMGEVEVPAIRGISLEIKKGEFIAIIGPSGSGKSTLMHILGCLDKPTKGIFYLDEEDILKTSENRLAAIRNDKIGFVFQQFNLLARRSALENVETPCLYAGKSRRERIRRARESLLKVGLEEKRFSHHPNQLSGGQRQRVAIARALINDPDIIFADEPTGALDTRSGDEILEIFQQLNKEGRTLILVTHERYVAQYAQRIIHVKDGKIDSEELIAQ